jgi:hypothetical protein
LIRILDSREAYLVSQKDRCNRKNRMMMVLHPDENRDGGTTSDGHDLEVDQVDF